MNSLESKIEHVSKNVYLLTNIPEFELDCQGKIEIRRGCKMCTLELQSNCAFSSTGYKIPATAINNDESDTDGTLRHVINAPLLIIFFQNESLSNLRGEFTYADEPSIRLPIFKYFRENISHSFTENDKTKIDLNKAVQAVKNDNQIVASLSESVILGEIPIQTSWWLSVPGLISEITTTFCFLLILHSLYLSYKIRYLGIAFALLQKNTGLKANGHKIILDYYENSITVVPQKGIHEIILQVTYENSSQILLGTCVIIMVLFLVKKIYTRCVHTRKVNLALTLELIGQNKCSYISICQLSGKYSDYKISATDFIKNLRVEGCLIQKLNFSWRNVKLTNLVTEQEVEINKSVKINWKESQNLKEIIKSAFRVNVVYMKKNEILRAKVDKIDEKSEQSATIDM
jgi:hypothetical protein